MTFEQEIRGAIARGYCHLENRSKVLDPFLCDAIAIEVIKVIFEHRAEFGVDPADCCSPELPYTLTATINEKPWPSDDEVSNDKPVPVADVIKACRESLKQPAMIMPRPPEPHRIVCVRHPRNDQDRDRAVKVARDLKSQDPSLTIAIVCDGIEVQDLSPDAGKPISDFGFDTLTLDQYMKMDIRRQSLWREIQKNPTIEFGVKRAILELCAEKCAKANAEAERERISKGGDDILRSIFGEWPPPKKPKAAPHITMDMQSNGDNSGMRDEVHPVERLHLEKTKADLDTAFLAAHGCPPELLGEPADAKPVDRRDDAMVIVDEASGVPTEVFEAVDKMFQTTKKPLDMQRILSPASYAAAMGDDDAQPRLEVRFSRMDKEVQFRFSGPGGYRNLWIFNPLNSPTPFSDAALIIEQHMTSLAIRFGVLAQHIALHIDEYGDGRKMADEFRKRGYVNVQAIPDDDDPKPIEVPAR